MFSAKSTVHSNYQTCLILKQLRLQLAWLCYLSMFGSSVYEPLTIYMYMKASNNNNMLGHFSAKLHYMDKHNS